MTLHDFTEAVRAAGAAPTQPLVVEVDGQLRLLATLTLLHGAVADGPLLVLTTAPTPASLDNVPGSFLHFPCDQEGDPTPTIVLT